MSITKSFSLAVALCAALTNANAQSCGLKDNGDGTMSDPASGLRIRTCAEGQNWTAGKCSGTAQKYKWDDAVQRFGRGEWRLMTKGEADQLVPPARQCLHGAEYSWTSSRNENRPPLVWYVNFFLGDPPTNTAPNEELQVRLVRRN